MDKVSSKNLERITWLDLCRVFAILGVVIIHSSGEVFYSFGKIKEIYWLHANFWDSIARPAVPLFVMISGALLLKNETLIYEINLGISLKKILKVLIPAATWSILFLMKIQYDTRPPSSQIIVNALLLVSQPIMYHLWFAYMILGLYLLLPILQVVFSACMQSSKFTIYFFVFWSLVNSLSVYVNIPILLPMQVGEMFSYGGYFLLGALLTIKRYDCVSTKNAMTLYIVGVASTFFITWLRTTYTGIPDELAYSYFSPNVLIASIGAFILVQRVSIKNTRIKHALSATSDACFFIYFIHVLILEFFRYGTFGLRISTINTQPIVAIPLLALATFCTSLFLAILIRRIPGASRLLG